MDQFPEKRKLVHKLEDGFDVKSIQSLLTQIMQFLMTKAIHESRKQDKYNPTTIGGITFHIEYNDITKETRLSFDKHPNLWNVSNIISEMQNREADIMMEKYAQEDILDNPFTY